MEEEKKETEVLFPEVEVYGVKVRPWTFEQFMKIIPLLKSAYVLFKEKSIQWENVEKALDAKDPGLLVETGMIDVFSDLMPRLPEFIALSLSLDRDEIVKWDFGKVFSVAFVIISQNAGRIKNLSGLGTMVFQALKVGR